MDHMRKANVVDQAAFACYHQSSCLFFPRRIVNWTARIFPGTNLERLGYTRLEFKPDHTNQ